MTGWWPFLQTGSAYFGGSVSNAAVYSKALTDAQIWHHYVAGTVSSAGGVANPASINASAQAAGLSVRGAPSTRRSVTTTPAGTPAAGPSVTPSVAPSVDPSVTPSVIPVPSWSAAPSIAAIAPTPVLPTPSLPESVTPTPSG